MAHGELNELCRASDGLLLATPYQQVDVTDATTVEKATRWWEELTGHGGEGMVVKPLEFVARGRHGLTQPAVKCRGPEYLRIICGPEYLLPANLERPRSRSTSAKRSLALREFALGVEALQCFVRREPLLSIDTAGNMREKTTNTAGLAGTIESRVMRWRNKDYGVGPRLAGAHGWWMGRVGRCRATEAVHF